MVGGFQRGGLVEVRSQRLGAAQFGEALQRFGGMLRVGVVAHDALQHLIVDFLAVFALGQAGRFDEALFGDGPVGRDLQDLIVDAQGVERVLEPRKPATEVATFAAFVLTGQVEGLLDGQAEAGKVGVALEEGVEVGLRVVELTRLRVVARASEEGDRFGVGAGFIFDQPVPEREGGAVFAHDRQVLGLVDRLEDGLRAARGLGVRGGAGLEAPATVLMDEFGRNRKAQQAAGCEERFSDEVHASGEGLRPR